MTRLVGSFTVQGLHKRALLEGAASAFDLRGDTRRQYSLAPTPEMADLEAICDDWEALGHDFEAAMKSQAPALHV